MSLRPPASPDPALNPRLSAILAKAREVGYPKSNVDTAMNKVRLERASEVDLGDEDGVGVTVRSLVRGSRSFLARSGPRTEPRRDTTNRTETNPRAEPYVRPGAPCRP